MRGRGCRCDCEAQRVSVEAETASGFVQCCCIISVIQRFRGRHVHGVKEPVLSDLTSDAHG